MIIIGAGMSGLIAGHYFRARRPMIVEQQGELPNNHEALLRFRSTEVSKTTGINFRKMRVRKSIMFKGAYADKANPFLANMYSFKVTGQVVGRSIWDMEDADRYIAPPDFISQAAAGLSILYGKNFDYREIASRTEIPLISTIPMPAMMRLVGWPNVPKFNYQSIWSAQLEFQSPGVDVAQTIYYPDLEAEYYRASISGKKMIIEFMTEPTGEDGLAKIIESICMDFGIPDPQFVGRPTFKSHRYGKIIGIDEDHRKDFMYHLTRDHNIYSLGRFATWRQILLDDVVNDCSVIGKMISAEDSRSLYNQRLHQARAS